VGFLRRRRFSREPGRERSDTPGHASEWSPTPDGFENLLHPSGVDIHFTSIPWVSSGDRFYLDPPRLPEGVIKAVSGWT
jgi:hypothetical protein